jgi:hypothetical protein
MGASTHGSTGANKFQSSALDIFYANETISDYSSPYGTKWDDDNANYYGPSSPPLSSPDQANCYGESISNGDRSTGQERESNPNGVGTTTTTSNPNGVGSLGESLGGNHTGDASSWMPDDVAQETALAKPSVRGARARARAMQAFWAFARDGLWLWNVLHCFCDKNGDGSQSSNAGVLGLGGEEVVVDSSKMWLTPTTVAQVNGLQVQ